MEKMTNKKIIKELLPILNEAVKNKDDIVLDEKDYYDHPYKSYYVNDIRVYYTSYQEGTLQVKAIKHLERGKFDYAVLAWDSWNPDTYGFVKEYKGKGNGFYADIDKMTGKIIASEWD